PLFRLLPDRIQVIDLIPRQDLERKIKTIRRRKEGWLAAEWEPIRKRRQRTPAVVALVSEGLSSETDPAGSWGNLISSGRNVTPERSGKAK
ncbi:MAG TPA: hypothetical protein VER98_08990, partial [Terriglobia bacterium]|nr:hypothetical protein [Terriglobia bacterium]